MKDLEFKDWKSGDFWIESDEKFSPEIAIVFILQDIRDTLLDCKEELSNIGSSIIDAADKFPE